MSSEEIQQRFQKLIAVLTKSMNEESDPKSVKTYERHIERTQQLLNSTNGETRSSDLIKEYYESESRNYGWGYLPNENGEIAESEFWKLMEDLGYYSKN